jgi:hypothetical protein
VQWFFKEDIQSHGCYTDDLRTFARKTRREILNQWGLEFLVQVADRLFTGPVLEEKSTEKSIRVGEVRRPLASPSSVRRAHSRPPPK